MIESRHRGPNLHKCPPGAGIGSFAHGRSALSKALYTMEEWMAATSSRLFRFFALALAASSAGCVTSPVYWPNSVNTPQVMRRGDVEGTMAVSSEGFTQLQ